VLVAVAVATRTGGSGFAFGSGTSEVSSPSASASATSGLGLRDLVRLGLRRRCGDALRYGRRLLFGVLLSLQRVGGHFVFRGSPVWSCGGELAVRTLG
jgi:hypothetical protein